MTAPVGSAVLYWSGGVLGLGRVAAEEKQRLRVTRPQGADERITPGRIALIVERSLPRSGADDRDELRALDAAIRGAALRVDVPLLWSLVRETAGAAEPGVDLEQLGPLAAADVPLGVARAATLIAIRDDRLHFERRGDRWLARAPETVQALRAERERVERRAQETDELYRVLAAAVRDGAARPAAGETAERVLGALRALAIDDDALDGAPRVAALDALRASGQAFERPGEGAFRLLRALGVWSDDDVNLQLERFAIRVAFPDAVRDLGARAARADLASAGRLDLTELPTLSIDGAHTREIDDALSIEFDGSDRPRIWIHIADPCLHIEPGDPVDLEALERGLSHYMPDLRVPMLPPELSHDAASLVAGRRRPALSFGVRIDADGRVADQQIARSVISSDARLSYRRADEMLAVDADGPDSDALSPVLGVLLRFATSRRAARLGDGALVLLAPDVDLHVDDAGLVTLERIDEDSPARLIVGEAMVLAGSIAAATCRDAGVPVLYRRQAAPSGQAPSTANEPIAGALQIYRRRRSLRRAEVRLEPGRHASLGVDAYCQATSPLRRFQDLACHRQLLAAIGDHGAAYDQHALRRIADTTGEAEQTARRAEAAARDYWRLRWLEQQRGAPFAAMVVEAGPRPRVLLDALQSVHTWAGAASLAPGEPVTLRVSRVNPRAGLVRFERAG